MKKIIAILLAVTLAFTFAACGKGTAEPSNGTSNSGGSAENSSKNDTAAPKSGKVLVVYYSATGSTKAVAETIAETAGADIFEIVPKDKYTSADLDWTDNGSRVNAEHDDESKRDVALEKTTPDNWSDYDIVFVGYPKMEYSL